MAKTTHRPNIPQETLERARRQMQQGGIVSATPAASQPVAEDRGAPAPIARRATSSSNLRAEYAYVLTDLRNMAILAATFLAVLIVLSFVI